MRHYGSDPVLMPPGRDAIVGREAVRDHYGRLLGNVDMAIEAESLETVIAGDWAIDRGVTRGRVTTRGGGDRRLNDRYLMLLRRDANGSWKISRLIWHEGPAGDGSQADALRPIDAVIRAFLEAADSHEWNRMSQVITPDHLFSLNGYEVRGEGDLKEIWQGWWDYAPEFHSEIVEIVPARDPSSATVLTRVSGPGVVRDGEYIEHEWSFPVAALVVVREGRVAEWREFYDASEMESIGEN